MKRRSWERELDEPLEIEGVEYDLNRKGIFPDMEDGKLTYNGDSLYVEFTPDEVCYEVDWGTNPEERAVLEYVHNLVHGSESGFILEPKTT